MAAFKALIKFKYTQILFQSSNIELYKTQASKTDPSSQQKKISPKSRTDLSEFEQEQFDLLMKQFKINLNEQKDGLMAIRQSIESSSKLVIKTNIITIKSLINS